MKRFILLLCLLLSAVTLAVAAGSETVHAASRPRAILHFDLYCLRASDVETFIRVGMRHPSSTVAEVLVAANAKIGRKACAPAAITISKPKVVKKLLLDGLDFWIYQISTKHGIRYMFLSAESEYRDL